MMPKETNEAPEGFTVPDETPDADAGDRPGAFVRCDATELEWAHKGHPLVDVEPAS